VFYGYLSGDHRWHGKDFAFASFLLVMLTVLLLCELCSAFIIH